MGPLLPARLARCPARTIQVASKPEAGTDLPLLASRRALLAATAAAAVVSLPPPQPAAAGGAPPPALPTPPPPPLLPCPAPAGEAAGRTAWNLGLATPAPDRDSARLAGLLPARVTSLETEIARAAAAVEPAVAARDAAHAASSQAPPAEREAAKATTNLAAYSALAAARLGVGDAAFFGLLRSDFGRYTPCCYTPSVGDACLKWGELPYRPPCLYLSSADAGRMEAVVRNWPLPPGAARPRLAVLTDGARILGLGDLGAQGAGIPVGKCLLHAAAGGLGPADTLPVSLDFGCDTERVRSHPLYPGLPLPRAAGRTYDALIGEALAALLARFGPGLIIHYEDFAAGTADALLRRAVACRPSADGRQGTAMYGEEGTTTLATTVCPPSFSDDIQATGAAALAALLGAAAIPGMPPLADGRFLFYGAGQAAVGSARAIVSALVDGGMAPDDACGRIFLLDSKGLVTRARPAGSLSALKAEFARPAGEAATLAPPGAEELAAIVSAIKPTVLVGAAAVGGAFTEGVLRALAAASPRPTVLALSNPDTAAECRAVDVDAFTEGRAVFAAGTAQPDHASTRTGRPVSPGFANNALVFPGVALGAAVSGASAIGEAAWLAAARAVAECVQAGDVAAERALPDVGRLVEVTAAVAAAVAAACVAGGGVDEGRCDARLLKAAGASRGSGRVSRALAAACLGVVKEAQYQPGSEIGGLKPVEVI